MLNVSNLRCPLSSVGVLMSTRCECSPVTSVSTLLANAFDQGVGHLGHIVQTPGAAWADHIATVDDQCRYPHQAHGAHAGVSLADLCLDPEGVQRFTGLLFTDTVLGKEAGDGVGVIEALPLFVKGVEDVGVRFFANIQSL